MAYSEELAARIRKALARRQGVAEKKMFGGLTFMLRRHMCCGVVNDELVLRLGPEQGEKALKQPYQDLRLAPTCRGKNTIQTTIYGGFMIIERKSCLYKRVRLHGPTHEGNGHGDTQWIQNGRRSPEVGAAGC